MRNRHRVWVLQRQVPFTVVIALFLYCLSFTINKCHTLLRESLARHQSSRQSHLLPPPRHNHIPLPLSLVVLRPTPHHRLVVVTIVIFVE